MYLLYSLVLTLGVIALLPRFIYDAFRHGKYAAGLWQRLGQLPPIETNGREVIWLHCVSVGETLAACPLARALLENSATQTLVVSTTTLTGQRVAREAFRDQAIAVFYFPFDWGWTVRRALRRVDPSLVLIMETELWPNFLRECRKRGVPAAVVNGRLSERSFGRYKMIRRFARRIVNDLDLAIMQTESDAERIRAVGLASERVLVSGNVKYDLPRQDHHYPLTAEIRKRFNFTTDNRLVVAASTHQPEERVIVDAFKQLRATRGHEDLRLLIAPRHPERFSEVASMLQTSGLSWARRSDAPVKDDSGCDVLLLDSIGELRAVYPLASVVFVGGSIAQTGGHNILEPAEAGVCIITGAYTYNFKAIVEGFLEEDALVQLPELAERDAPAALAEALRNILSDEGRARTLVENARAVLERSKGATARTIKLLSPILARASNSKAQETEAARRGRLSA